MIHIVCSPPELSDSPLFVVRVAVAVVLGVGAVPVDATGTFLDARPRAPPVEVLLVAATHPPCVWGPIWGANTDTHKQKNKNKKTMCKFKKKNSFWLNTTAVTKRPSFVKAIKLCD